MDLDPALGGRRMQLEVHRHIVLHCALVLRVRVGAQQNRKDLPDASAQQRLSIDAVVELRLTVDVRVAPFPVERVERIGEAFEDSRVSLVRFFELRLGLFARADVHQCGQRAADGTILVEQRRGIPVEVLYAAVIEHDFVLFARQLDALGGRALQWQLAKRQLAAVVQQPVRAHLLFSSRSAARKIDARIGRQQCTGGAIAGDPAAFTIVCDIDADRDQIHELFQLFHAQLELSLRGFSLFARALLASDRLGVLCLEQSADADLPLELDLSIAQLRIGGPIAAPAHTDAGRERNDDGREDRVADYGFERCG
jgi:hypothetical protein